MKRHRTLKLIAKIWASTMIIITAFYHPIVWHLNERITRNAYKDVLKSALKK